MVQSSLGVRVRRCAARAPAFFVGVLAAGWFTNARAVRCAPVRACFFCVVCACCLWLGFVDTFDVFGVCASKRLILTTLSECGLCGDS
mmetsp:Transcript_38835/g.95571  ORF Transcript_38835/g.95571 Transcript_38835/m.95571 type:complete len:88 (+) Transcript_38835:112-375(+)